MQKWFKYFIFLSLAFLLIALYRANYLKVPIIYSYTSVGISFLLLGAGFIVNGLSWKAVLAQSEYKASGEASIAGFGLSIFAKYIPGKVLVILGRAGYIATRYTYPMGKLSALSLSTQFIALWMGLTMGTLGLFVVGGFDQWKWLILSLWLFLTVVVFSKVLHGLLEKAVKVILKKNIHIPTLDTVSSIKVLPWFAAFWALWSAGFYFLVQGTYPHEVPFAIGLALPLSVALGIMAAIAPGGIGIREGFLSAFLVLAGFELADATTISVTSRLWFLIGESFIFILGWWLDRKVKVAQ